MRGTLGDTKVVFVGQGYVGLPVAIRAVEVGFDVVGYDLDADCVKGLATGTSHIEDVADERVQRALDSGRYRPTADAADLAGFDVAVISVPTPLRHHVPDTTCMESAASAVGAHLRPGATVVLESTTYPGTTEELLGPILEEASGLQAGTDFHLGYSPERIDPGNAVWTLVNTPKVVSGIDAASLEAVQWFYDQLVDTTVPTPTTREAELTKLLENTFRHVNIALVNELAIFAHGLGVDVWAALDAAATKPFGFMRFTPGPGVGGHCLAIDPTYLSWQVRQQLGHTFRFVELANDVNEHMPEYVVRRIVLHLNQRELAVRGRRILVLGLAYKPNTHDTRESPSVPICQSLLDLGAEVRAADPHVHARDVPPGVVLVDAIDEEVDAADLVVVLVDHAAFGLPDLLDRVPHVLDTRGCMPRDGRFEHL